MMNPSSTNNNNTDFLNNTYNNNSNHHHVGLMVNDKDDYYNDNQVVAEEEEEEEECITDEKSTRAKSIIEQQEQVGLRTRIGTMTKNEQQQQQKRQQQQLPWSVPFLLMAVGGIILLIAVCTYDVVVSRTMKGGGSVPRDRLSSPASYTSFLRDRSLVQSVSSIGTYMAEQKQDGDLSEQLVDTIQISTSNISVGTTAIDNSTSADTMLEDGVNILSSDEENFVTTIHGNAAIVVAQPITPEEEEDNARDTDTDTDTDADDDSSSGSGWVGASTNSSSTSTTATTPTDNNNNDSTSDADEELSITIVLNDRSNDKDKEEEALVINNQNTSLSSLITLDDGNAQNQEQEQLYHPIATVVDGKVVLIESDTPKTAPPTPEGGADNDEGAILDNQVVDVEGVIESTDEIEHQQLSSTADEEELENKNNSNNSSSNNNTNSGATTAKTTPPTPPPPPTTTTVSISNEENVDVEGLIDSKDEAAAAISNTTTAATTVTNASSSVEEKEEEVEDVDVEGVIDSNDELAVNNSSLIENNSTSSKNNNITNNNTASFEKADVEGVIDNIDELEASATADLKGRGISNGNETVDKIDVEGVIDSNDELPVTVTTTTDNNNETLVMINRTVVTREIPPFVGANSTTTTNNTTDTNESVLDLGGIAVHGNNRENDPAKGAETEHNEDDIDNEDLSRIVGGAPVEKGRYPYYAFTAGTELCGGTLIHPDIILTAAHCDNAWLENGALIGGVLIDGSDNVAFSQVDSEVPHPLYHSISPTDETNDIMLVRLTTTFPDGPFATLNFDPAVPSVGETTTVIGLGATSDGGDNSDILLGVNVNVVSFDDCTAALGNTVNDTVQICAGDNAGGKDSCQGDSGGPLFTSSDAQVGIVSYGSGCGQAGIPAVYVRVSTYEQWIQDTICEISAVPPPSCSSTGAPGATDSPTTSSTQDATPDTTRDGTRGSTDSTTAPPTQLATPDVTRSDTSFGSTSSSTASPTPAVTPDTTSGGTPGVTGSSTSSPTPGVTPNTTSEGTSGTSSPAPTDFLTPSIEPTDTLPPITNPPDTITAVPAGIGEFPSFAFTGVRGRDSTYCGATLIAPDTILTSAQCASIFARSGVYIGGTSLDGSGSEFFTVEYVIPNFLYNPDTASNDIMIVKLSGNIAAPVQVLNGDSSVPSISEPLTVLRFGVSYPGNVYYDVLFKETVYVVSEAECREFWGDIYNSEIHICTSGSSCTGDDSGSPLLTASGVQVGIVASGCVPNEPALYTRISAYARWITGAVHAEPDEPSLTVCSSSKGKKSHKKRKYCVDGSTTFKGKGSTKSSRTSSLRYRDPDLTSLIFGDTLENDLQDMGNRFPLYTWRDQDDGYYGKKKYGKKRVRQHYQYSRKRSSYHETNDDYYDETSH